VALAGNPIALIAAADQPLLFGRMPVQMRQTWPTPSTRRAMR
jgi:hypothetical protein